MIAPASGVLDSSGLPPASLPREYFTRALRRGRLSHAYLFLGAEGSGRRRFARELSKTIFCRRGSPCGACPSCQAIEHGNHPAVHVYATAEGKGSVEIGDVRDLSARIHLKRSDLLISIIEDAGRMTLPAANAVLKTLEEPTGEALLILLAESTGGLLPTIVSRCHRILFPGAGEGEAAGAAPPAAAEAERLEEEASRPDLLAGRDLRGWLAELFPAASHPREAVRSLAEGLLEAARARLGASVRAGEALRWADLDRLEALLDLLGDLDRNVHPDLVLEGALALLRRT